MLSLQKAPLLQAERSDCIGTTEGASGTSGGPLPVDTTPHLRGDPFHNVLNACILLL